MYTESRSFNSIVQPSVDELLEDRFELKGKWSSDFHKNEKPLVLELGCGKGDYSLKLAQKYPEKNFLGVDVKGDRMLRGARIAHENGIKNIGFLRTLIENIGYAFSTDEVDEIWITFPDPQQKDRWERKRLTSPTFLNRYKKFLKKDGIIHLKTDSEFFYEYTLAVATELKQEIITSIKDVYAVMPENDAILTQT
ncbi:MAG: tRNA (guanosine(46)-N7)-methyltransferase TrmB, partial [Bacteroidales bacterium]|nr:tRNA (guanosine(46)-N7)-methyltransferase TrmB [Bacteroidales bacterium]